MRVAMRSSTQSVVVMLDDSVIARGLESFRSSVLDVMSGGEPVLVVDVSGVHRLSSAVVGALLWVQRTCAARQVEVQLRGVDHRGRQLLTRTGLRSMLVLEPPSEMTPSAMTPSAMTPDAMTDLTREMGPR
jgi:anti-anti-sigma factor